MKVKTSVYCKPTSTDRYIHFCSHHQRRVLRSTVCSMRDGAHNLCTDTATSAKELSQLTEVFERNAYPRTFIIPILNRPPKHSATGDNTEGDVENKEEKKPKLLYLPYVQGISERIERGYCPLGIRTVFKSHHTLRQVLMRVKNTTPRDWKVQCMRSHVESVTLCTYM